MMFNNVKGYPGSRVLVGLLASRERVSHLLGAPVRELGIQMGRARLMVTPPVGRGARGSLVPGGVVDNRRTPIPTTATTSTSP